MFRYNAYWRTWNRVMLNNFNGEYIEIGLTPINQDWEGVKQERIRVHRTEPGSNDKTVESLPAEIEKLIADNVGWQLKNRLMMFDYLSNVDWPTYRRLCNGGVPFEACRRRGA